MRMPRRSSLVRVWKEVLAAVVVTAIASMAQAALVSPDGVSAGSEFDVRIDDNTINQSGLLAGAHSTAPADMWLADFPNANEEITWTFTSPISSDGMQFWNYNEGPNDLDRGVAEADIELYLGGGLVTTITDQSFTIAPGLSSYTGEFISFGGVFTIDEVRLTNTEPFPTSDNTIGISEVQFNVIPSPAALPAGLALLAMAAVRRRRTA